MRAIPRRLRSPTAGSVVAGLGIQAALVVSGPILARMLGLEGRGQLAALILWPIVIAQLGSLGLLHRTSEAVWNASTDTRYLRDEVPSGE